MRITGIIVLACGLAALAYGGFVTSRHSRDIVLDNIAVAMSGRQYGSVPLWAGTALVLVGAGLVMTDRK